MYLPCYSLFVVCTYVYTERIFAQLCECICSSVCACVWIVSCVFFINRVAIMTMSDVFSRKFFLPAKYANMAVRTTDTNIKAMLKHSRNIGADSVYLCETCKNTQGEKRNDDER